MEHKVVTDYSNVGLDSNSNVKVFVRLRPPDNGSAVPKEMFTQESERKLIIKDPSNKQYGEHAYAFDRVFWTDTPQEELFLNTTVSLIDHCFEGYNSCCFAYGQTGSGKTYSMFGDTGTQRGIIPRAVEYIFEGVEARASTKNIAVVVSFLEMYRDQVRDLGKAYLAKGDRSVSAEKTSDWYLKSLKRGQSFSGKSSTDSYASENLGIHEDLEGNVFAKGLSVLPVSTPEEVVTIMRMGFRLRATHETKMNAVSSRSHTVFTINIVQKDKATGETVAGMLNLVDLAGSERLHKSESSGQRLQEALSINSSLSALGKVVMALDPSQPGQYVPYRDSKLTRLLQNSIGGNSHTALLATIHPRVSDYEECLSTLQFANRCRSVTNKPRVNYLTVSVEEKDRRIAKLQTELTFLRGVQHRLMSVLAARLGPGESLAPLLGLPPDALPEVSALAAAGAGHAGGAGGDTSDSAVGFGRAMHGAAPVAGPAVAELKRKLDAEQASSATLRERLTSTKRTLAAFKARSMSEAATVRRHAAKRVQHASEVTQQVKTAEAAMQAKMAAREAAFQSELEAVLDNNKRLVKSASDMVFSIPAALRRSAKARRDSVASVAEIRVHESRKAKETVAMVKASHAVELKAVEANHAAEVKLLRKALDGVKADARSAEEAFTTKVAAMEDELWELATYGQALSELLQGLRSGRVPVVQATSGDHAFYIPPSVLPPDPLTPKDALKHTKAVLAARAEAAARPRSAVAVVRRLREAFPERPPLTARRDQPAADGGVDVDALRRELRKEVEDAVLTELTEHSTVDYIRRLEQSKARYQQQLQEEVARHRDLRVAYAAQQRRLEKLQATGRKKRPQSASLRRV